MNGKPKPTYSPHRHRWLQLLADYPGSRAVGKGHTAWACEQLGWTAPDGPTSHMGYALTEAGRAILDKWNADGTQPAPRAPAPLLDAQGMLDMVEREGWEIRHDPGNAWSVVYGARRPRVMGYGTTVVQAIVAASNTLHREEVMPAPRKPAPAPGAPVCAPQAPPDRSLDLGGYHPAPPIAPSLGSVPLADKTECPGCSGKGQTGHGFVCQTCQGMGRIRRSVPA